MLVISAVMLGAVVGSIWIFLRVAIEPMFFGGLHLASAINGGVWTNEAIGMGLACLIVVLFVTGGDLSGTLWFAGAVVVICAVFFNVAPRDSVAAALVGTPGAVGECFYVELLEGDGGAGTVQTSPMPPFFDCRLDGRAMSEYLATRE